MPPHGTMMGYNGPSHGVSYSPVNVMAVPQNIPEKGCSEPTAPTDEQLYPSAPPATYQAPYCLQPMSAHALLAPLPSQYSVQPSSQGQIPTSQPPLPPIGDQPTAPPPAYNTLGFE